jgi:hypothetical protein
MTDLARLPGDGRYELSLQDHVDASARTVRRAAALLLCTVVFFLSAYAGLLNDYLGVAIVTGALVLGFPAAGRSSLASVIVVTGFAIFAMPFIGLVYVGELLYTAWFALFVIFSIVLDVYGDPPPRPAAPLGHGNADMMFIVAYLVLGLILWGDEGLRQISFYAGWALALVHLERIHARTTAMLPRVMGLMIYVAVIGYFAAVLWGGGGRIVQLSFMLAPILLTAYYRTFRLNIIVFALAAVGLSFIGRVLRFGWSDGLQGLSVDSGASPITITSYLWETKAQSLSIGSIVDQWALLFLNWFPRELWPNKPLGVGTTFVDVVFGRAGVSAEHNLAIGIFGEHMFFLPHAWIVSVALLAGVIILMRRALIRVGAPYRAPVIAFDVWLMTLFWGGMAAFAARVWFALIPIIPYVMLIRWLDRRKRLVQEVPGSAGAPDNGRDTSIEVTGGDASPTTRGLTL